jgi:hypothetical protein
MLIKLCLINLFVILILTNCNINDYSSSTSHSKTDLFPNSIWSKVIDISPYSGNVLNYGIAICPGKKQDFYVYGSDAGSNMIEGVWINRYDVSGKELYRKRLLVDSGGPTIEKINANDDGTVSLLLLHSSPPYRVFFFRLDSMGTTIDSVIISDNAYYPELSFAINGTFVELWNYSNGQYTIKKRTLNGNIDSYVNFQLPFNSHPTTLVHRNDNSFLLGVTTITDSGRMSTAIKIDGNGRIVWTNNLHTFKEISQGIYWAKTGLTLLDLFFDRTIGEPDHNITDILYAIDNHGNIIATDTLTYLHPVNTHSGNILFYKVFPCIIHRYTLTNEIPCMFLDKAYTVTTNDYFSIECVTELLSGEVVVICRDQSDESYHLVCLPRI